MKFSRRDFLATAALTSASLATGIESDAQETTTHDHKPRQTTTMAEPVAYKRPMIICKATGVQGIDAAYDMLRNGQDTLDAVLHVCKMQEDDPNDDSVGLGGLPNEEAWWSLTHVACTVPRGAPDRWAVCATSKMFASSPKP